MSVRSLKVVGIVASPRKGMNTDTLVNRTLEGAASRGAITEKLYLNHLEIKPCQACAKHPAAKHCWYEDGMQRVYELLENTNALVIGTPAYYDSISAQLKLVVDRSNCLTERIKLDDGSMSFKPRLVRRKKTDIIWVADFSRNPEHALATVKLWCKDANIELVDVLLVADSNRGEGARNLVALLKRAYEMGVVLAEE
jgi:multimeric flavodoxin WrbA